MGSFKLHTFAEMTVAHIRAGMIRHMDIPVAVPSCGDAHLFYQCVIQDAQCQKTVIEMKMKQGSFSEDVQPPPLITLRLPRSAYNIYRLASTTLANFQEQFRGVLNIPDTGRQQPVIHPYNSTIIKRNYWYKQG